MYIYIMYQYKYLKYKTKYLKLKNQKGGSKFINTSSTFLWIHLRLWSIIARENFVLALTIFYLSSALIIPIVSQLLISKTCSFNVAVLVKLKIARFHFGNAGFLLFPNRFYCWNLTGLALFLAPSGILDFRTFAVLRFALNF